MQFNLNASIDLMTDNVQTYVSSQIKQNSEIYKDADANKVSNNLNMDSFLDTVKGISPDLSYEGQKRYI